MSYLNPKWVEGRTIKEFRPGAYMSYGVRMHNPTIVLDNGAEIVFLAEEDPAGGEYGIMPIYRKPPVQP